MSFSWRRLDEGVEFHFLDGHPLDADASPHFLGSVRPRPLRGDWFRSRRCGKIRLRAYWTAPSMGLLDASLPAFPDVEIPPGVYVGPVHDIDVTDTYVAVLVPHPVVGDALVWINVWCSHGKHFGDPPVDFAIKVPDHETARWYDRGWRNVYGEILRADDWWPP